MKESSRLTISKVTADTSGSMDESMKDFGRTTKCTVRAPLFGLMAASTRESMSMKRKRAMVSSLGPTGDATRDNGRTASKTARESTGTKKAWRGVGCGPTGERSDGLSE